MAGLQVCVRSGNLIVAETRSNEFGEFQMEYEQQNRLQLCVYLEGDGKYIQIPLKRFASEKPAAAERLKLASDRPRRARKKLVKTSDEKRI
jgi:hypothetical protein